jgi:hypothetical protein
MKKYIFISLFLICTVFYLFPDGNDKDFILGKWKFQDNMIIRMIGMQEGIDFDVDVYMPYELAGVLEFTGDRIYYYDKDRKNTGMYNIYRHKNVSSCYYVDMIFENKNVIPFLPDEISLVIYIIDKNTCNYCIYSNFIASIYTGILTKVKD